MATFNDIIGCTLKIDNQKSKFNSDKKNNTANSELILEGNANPNPNLNGNGNVMEREILFTMDETKPIEGNVAHDLIYYLDNTKIYTPTKQLGKYTLKNHQLTSLYYMRGLEQMLYDIRRTVKNPDNNKDNNEDKLIISSTHYTNVGVLSDKVGAGKSYCIMALLNEAKSLSYKQLPFRDVVYGSNDIKLKDFNKLDTNILLVPHGLVGQWKKYLEDSGLKFLTIQKAKDIFELADNTCKFKGKHFSMVAKEDDEKVGDEKIIDSGDEEISDEDNTQSTNSTKSKKTSTATAKSAKSAKSSKTPKTKATLNTTSDNAKDAKDDMNVGSKVDTTNKPKKKVVISKRSKEDAKAEEIKLAEKHSAIQDELEEDKEDKEDNKEDNKDEEDTSVFDKKYLEKQKKKLSDEYNKLNAQYNTKNASLWHHNYNSPQRQTISNECSIIQKKRDEIKKQLNDITEKIKANELDTGAIKVTDIQTIHKCFETGLNILPTSLESFITNLGHLDKTKVEKLDVILVSATFYNLFALYLNQDKYTVNRIIIDECNSIKGNRLVEVRRIFTWLITSSISSMMTSSGYIKKQIPDPQYGYARYTRERTVNSTGFILNIIKEMYEHQAENNKLYLVNRPEYIEQSMSLPEMKTILVISKDNLNIQVLGGIVSHDVLQMLNAGDIDGIVTKLDVAVGNETNVIEMVTSKFQDELKVKEYELKVAIENPKYNPNNETIGVINKRIAIKELKDKIACIEERVMTIESCPICFDDFNNPSITPCCNNKFCFDCITMALNSKSQCPQCKAELTIQKMIVISNKTKADMGKPVVVDKNKKKALLITPDSYEGKMELLKDSAKQFSKYENMDKIFELNNDNTVKKYLIFTEYESSLNDKITNILTKWNLSYARIKGSGIMISNTVEQYKTGKINTLLINSKYFGSGMNLENTTDIIIIHKMQSDVEMQVIGRAQRFGRVGNLRVWKLYYQNEVEN
jgi:hypothetical protein